MALEDPRSAACALDRLREWSQDELHITRSVRMHEPIYANPAALRADVRLAVEAADALQTCLHQLGESGYFSDPDYPEIDAALVAYERLVGVERDA